MLEKILSFNNINISWKEQPLLQNLNLRLNKGEKVSLSGISGSGKSTLASVIALNYPLFSPPAYSGEMHFYQNGKILSWHDKKDRENIREQTAMVFQDPRASFHPLWKMKKQIRLLTRNSDKDLLNTLFSKNSDHYLNKYPHQLSGGELQRLSFFIALSRQPDILIADEPVSSLDTENTNIINDLIRGYEKTVFYISHDLPTEISFDKYLKIKSNSLHEIKNKKNKKYPPLNIKPDLVLHEKIKDKKIKAGNSDLFYIREFPLFRSGITGIYGESGAGKSRFMRWVSGADRDHYPGTLQYHYIFQNPLQAFNPDLKIKNILRNYDKRKDDSLIIKLLESCKVDKSLLGKYPEQLSGGQLQRMAIVRAIVNAPDVLIIDEGFEAVQRELRIPLIRLCAEHISSIIFVSHDLELLQNSCHQIFCIKNKKLITH